MPYPLLLSLAMVFSSCAKEEETLSDREFFEQELRELIREHNLNRIEIFIGDGNSTIGSNKWTFRNGFLILDDNRRFFDLDKLRSYEVTIFPNEDRRLRLWFI